MNIYIPIPPIELFTWLAIYMQFNLVFYVVVFGPLYHYGGIIDAIKNTALAALVLLPVVTFSPIGFRGFLSKKYMRPYRRNFSHLNKRFLTK